MLLAVLLGILIEAFMKVQEEVKEEHEGQLMIQSGGFTTNMVDWISHVWTSGRMACCRLLYCYGLLQGKYEYQWSEEQVTLHHGRRRPSNLKHSRHC